MFGLLVVSGCGSDGGSDDETAPAGSADGTDPADAESESDDEPDGASEPAADDDFCTKIAGIGDEVGAIDPAMDPADAMAAFEEALTVLEGVDAPEELSGAWADLTTFFRSYVDALEGVDVTDGTAVGEALTNAGEDMFAAAASAQAALTEIGEYAENVCGVSLDEAGDASGGGAVDPCEMLDDAALSTVFAGGPPEPTLEDMGAGFAMCEWVDGETEVWVTVQPPASMDDFLETGGTEIDDPALGEGALTYETSLGLGRVSTGGGSVAFVSADVGVMVAVRGDAIDDPVATAVALATSTQ